MSLKKITVKVDLIVEGWVDAEDLVLSCDYSFSDFENRIQATQLSGYTVKSASGEILEDVEGLK